VLIAQSFYLGPMPTNVPWSVYVQYNLRPRGHNIGHIPRLERLLEPSLCRYRKSRPMAVCDFFITSSEYHEHRFETYQHGRRIPLLGLECSGRNVFAGHTRDTETGGYDVCQLGWKFHSQRVGCSYHSGTDHHVHADFSAAVIIYPHEKRKW